LSGWRYYLQSLPSRQWVDKDLPLTGVEVTTACSAPAAISGDLPIEFAALKNADGTLAVRKWGSLIVAEEEGRDPVVGIVDEISIEGEKLHIEAGGFGMYLTGMPWMGADFAGVKVDPLDIVRKIWGHVQSYPSGDLGVSVDATTSLVRIGEEEPADDAKDAADVGPFRLASWVTDDLGKVVDDLASDTPFQYMERSTWDGEELKHRLELGYPSIGVRRQHIRFEIGVNVTLPPSVDESDYASAVFVTGAGEGRKRISSYLTQPTDRLRRVEVVADSSLELKASADIAARSMLERLRGGYVVDSLDIVDHGLAPFGTFGPGDQGRLVGDAGWIDLDLWVRILEMTKSPETGAMSLKLEAV
jgi:hypothetical protein